MQIRWQHLYARKTRISRTGPMVLASVPRCSSFQLRVRIALEDFPEKVKSSFFGMLSTLLRDFMEINSIFRGINIKN